MSRLDDVAQRAVLEIAGRNLRAYRKALEDTAQEGVTPTYDNPLGILREEGQKAINALILIAEDEFKHQAENEVLTRFKKLLLDD